MILALRTDKPEAEIYLLEGTNIAASHKWQAHRQLSNTLLEQIKNLIKENDAKLSDLSAILIYSGPGSFTGLRIGVSVANALAYALDISIFGSGGESWLDYAGNIEPKGYKSPVVPEYGSEARITHPRK